jgi:hypothetical protein
VLIPGLGSRIENRSTITNQKRTTDFGHEKKPEAAARTGGGSIEMNTHRNSRPTPFTVVNTLICALAVAWLANHANAQVMNIAQLHSNLCAITTCPFAPPVLKSVDSASVVSPGGKVVLQGANFNSADGTPGQIVLKLGSKVPMTIIYLGNTGPSVYHQSYVERQLTVLGWADAHVFGQIPADISGVIDGNATFEVWRSDGAKSGPVTAHFTAARDLVILPLSDVVMKSCVNTADSNLCNQWSDSSQLSIPAHAGFNPMFSIFGQHTMFIPNQTQYQATGIDTYSFDLKNGWTLDDSYQFENGNWSNHACKSDFLSNEDFRNSKPNSDTPISSDVRLWWIAGCNLEYSVALHITGPKGVPWK